MKKIILIFIILQASIFARDNILIFKPKISQNILEYEYINYAISDIIKKNLNIYSLASAIEVENSNYSYDYIKQNITKIAEKYTSNIIFTYKIETYKNGIIITFFIYNISTPEKWFESEIYSTEDNIYLSINKILKTMDKTYSYSKNTNLAIDYNTYTSLIGYYKKKINTKNNENEELYSYFLNFYQDNIYFNIDYLEFSFKNGNNNNAILKETENIMGANHHYILYLKAYEALNKYKKNVLEDDIKNAIEIIDKSINIKNNNYKYHLLKSQIHAIENNYESAIDSLQTALKINNENIQMKKEIIYLLEKNK